MLRTALFFTLATLLLAGCGVKKETHQRALNEITSLQGRLDDCEGKRDEHAANAKQLQSELDKTRTEMTEADKEKAERIAKLREEMAASEQELLELRKQRDAAEKRAAAFRNLTDRFRALVDTGKLQVGFRNGQMVLKMPSEILFASGQAELSEAGQTALAEVLTVLMDFKDRRFVIAGHTDDKPIKTRKIRNNWELSTARALSVTEFMIEGGFPPGNVAAAGYGQFDPAAPNDTDENRALNRRIEIILVPDLSELPTLTNDQS